MPAKRARPSGGKNNDGDICLCMSLVWPRQQICAFQYDTKDMEYNTCVKKKVVVLSVVGRFRLPWSYVYC